MKFIQISEASPQLEKLREGERSYFSGSEFLTLRERRVKATREKLDELLEYYHKNDPELYAKLKKPIDKKDPKRWLFWPRLAGDRDFSLLDIIDQGISFHNYNTYFVENDEGELIGYCGYKLENGIPTNIHMFSWKPGLTKFDSFTMFSDLVEKYGKITWTCVKENPFRSQYDDLIENKKLNGYKVKREELFDKFSDPENAYEYTIEKP